MAAVDLEAKKLFGGGRLAADLCEIARMRGVMDIRDNAQGRSV